MRVFVEYFDDEPREPLRLSEEQWGIMAHPQPKAASPCRIWRGQVGEGTEKTSGARRARESQT